MNRLLEIAYHYYNEKPFEKGGRLYKGVGIHYFKRIVPFGDYTFMLIRLFYKKANIVRMREHAASFVLFTLFVETVHVLFFLLLNYLLLKKYVTTGEVNFKNIFINIIVNLLPILVQRYNRFRLLRSFNLTLNNFWRLLILDNGSSSNPTHG